MFSLELGVQRHAGDSQTAQHGQEANEDTSLLLGFALRDDLDKALAKHVLLSPIIAILDTVDP